MKKPQGRAPKTSEKVAKQTGFGSSQSYEKANAKERKKRKPEDSVKDKNPQQNNKGKPAKKVKDIYPEAIKPQTRDTVAKQTGFGSTTPE